MAHAKPLLIAAVVALALAGAAFADKPVIRFNASDQAAARATVLKAGDLGTGWKGGFKKPDLSSAPPCAGFHPKQSDLVTTGAAETEFVNGPDDVDSEAQIQQTAKMVELDWQRTFSPKLLPCLREAFKQALGAKAKVVSLERVAFPRVAAHAAAFRAFIDAPAGGKTIRVVSDLVAFGKGRTELTLTVSAPAGAATAVHQLEIQLARVMVGRVTA